MRTVMIINVFKNLQRIDEENSHEQEKIDRPCYER